MDCEREKDYEHDQDDGDADDGGEKRTHHQNRSRQCLGSKDRPQQNLEREEIREEDMDFSPSQAHMRQNLDLCF